MAEHTERGADRRQGDRRGNFDVAGAVAWYALGIASRRQGERRQRERRTGIDVRWIEAEEAGVLEPLTTAQLRMVLESVARSQGVDAELALMRLQWRGQEIALDQAIADDHPDPEAAAWGRRKEWVELGST